MIQKNRRKLEYRYSRVNYNIDKQEETRIQIQGENYNTYIGENYNTGTW